MSWTHTPFVLLPIFAAAINTALAAQAWRRRGGAAQRAFAALMVALALWALAYGLRFLATDLATRVRLLQVMYLGVAAVPVAWLVFALQYTGEEVRPTRPLIAVPALVSLATIGLVWTNDAHHLMWSRVWLDTSGPLPMLASRGGPWYWLNLAYTYLALGAGIVRLSRALPRSRRLFRRQALALTLAVLAPAAATLWYALRLGPLPAFDPTSSAFTVSGLAFAWGLLRFRLLDIVPVVLDINIEQMSDGVIVLDPRARIVNLNPAAEELVGRPLNAVLGMRAAAALPGWPETIVQPREGGELHAEHGPGDGTARTWDARVSPIRRPGGRLRGWLLVLRDITERRQLEAQLRHAQQLEAVGKLAGGLAHEFNNLLTVINGFAELLADHMSPEDPMRGCAEEIARAGERAAGLTRQLLAFGRRQVLAPEILDLNTVLAHLEPMLRPLAGASVRLAIVPGSGLGAVRVDRSQIEQAIVSLVAHASDSMPQGGTVTLETADVELGEDDARAHRGVVPGRYVRLRASDTGPGLDLPTQARVFEPFFAARAHGRDSGLGLASVYGTVRQSGGHVWVTSDLGRGTTFHVHLPRVDSTASHD